MRALIVGAGLSGLALGRQLLQARPALEVSIVEKSRGVGGRMATRRSDHGRFDHGAQFYALKPPIADLHTLWTAAALTNPYFTMADSERFCAKNGMTALAKNLASELPAVQLETRLANLSETEDGRIVAGFEPNAKNGDTNGDNTRFDVVALTCPVPQSVEILRASSWAIPDGLQTIRYAKALIGLIEWTSPPDRAALPAHGYLELAEDDGFHTVVDQRAKGLHSGAAWTVTMSPTWSERMFDRPEPETLHEMLTLLHRRFGEGKTATIQLKKWRYAHPLTAAESPFALAGNHRRTILLGDGFGGPSLNGAMRSACATSEWLLKNVLTA